MKFLGLISDLVVTKPKRRLLIMKFMIIQAIQVMFGMNTAKANIEQSNELLLASIVQLNGGTENQNADESGLLLRLGAAATQNVCPIETKLGNNRITVNWRGVNLENTSVKQKYEKTFTEILPHTIEQWVNKPGDCKLLIDKMKSMKVTMRDSTMAKVFERKWPIQQQLILIETFFSYLENKQKMCGISEELISSIQQRTLEALGYVTKDAETSFETCPWELCRSNEGTSSVLLMMKATLTAMGLGIVMSLVMKYRKGVIKNRVLDQIDIEVPIEKQNIKQKMIRISKIGGQFVIIMCNMVLVLIPAKWTQNLVCNAKI